MALFQRNRRLRRHGIINCDDTDTAEAISKTVGDYDDTKSSVSYRGILLPTSQGYSEGKERRHIIDVSDLMALKETGEIVLLLEGKYFRVKKIEYWRDRELSPVSDALRCINQNVAK